MTLLDAIKAAASGTPIASCEGRVYKPEQLAPIWITNNAASFRSCEMTTAEERGVWTIE